jgi:hypothetical protein
MIFTISDRPYMLLAKLYVCLGLVPVVRVKLDLRHYGA